MKLFNHYYRKKGPEHEAKPIYWKLGWETDSEGIFHLRDNGGVRQGPNVLFLIYYRSVCRSTINRHTSKLAIMLLIVSLRPQAWIAYPNTPLQAKHGLS